MDWLSNEGLEELRLAGVLDDVLDGHASIQEIRKGAHKGKFKVIPNRTHGQSNSKVTTDGLLMEAQVQRTQQPIVVGNIRPSKDMRMAGELLLSPSAISYFAGVGLRGNVNDLSPAERLVRAQNRLGDLERGYDSSSGALLHGVGLDGGHIAAHSTNPELSTDANNMKFENQYVNRVKGNAEGEAAVSRIRNSLKRRLREGGAAMLQQIARGWQP